MSRSPLTVVWISFFPIEWLPDLPEHLKSLPRLHPATWQRVLMSELQKAPGLRLHIVVLRRHFARDESFERDGVTFHLLKTPPGSRATSFFWLDTLRIRKVLDRIKPDVVHAWGTEKGAALVASRLGRPTVVTIQGLCVWIKDLFPVTFYERFLAVIERYTLKRLPKGTVVTAESTFSSAYLRQQYPNLDVRRVDVVPDSLFHRVERRPRLSPRRLIFVGELGPRKGGDTLVLALDKLQARELFELIVIGGVDPAFLAAMKSTTSPALWERISFKGGLSSAEVANELAQGAMMICPTRADTGPMAVKEAAVAGLPIVASRVGGVPDYVAPGFNGLLAEPGNLDAWVRTLAEAIAHPLFGLGKVDLAYLEKLRAALSPKAMANSFIAEYEAAWAAFNNVP